MNNSNNGRKSDKKYRPANPAGATGSTSYAGRRPDSGQRSPAGKNPAQPRAGGPRGPRNPSPNSSGRPSGTYSAERSSRPAPPTHRFPKEQPVRPTTMLDTRESIGQEAEVQVVESQKVDEDIIAGRNAVLEAFRAGREIDSVWIVEEEGAVGGFAGKLRALARETGTVVKTANRMKLDSLAPGVRHQGVVAIACAASYVELADILAAAREKGHAPFLVIADEIEDPHNLGAIIRTAEACGADGLILPKRRSASLNATVYKTSAGAASVLPVARVANLASCIRELKQQNIWIYGTDMDGQSWDTLEYDGGAAIVIGSEGKGISRVIREECDFIVSLPMAGQINSLNASVAAGIILYQAARKRGVFHK